MCTFAKALLRSQAGPQASPHHNHLEMCSLRLLPLPPPPPHCQCDLGMELETMYMLGSTCYPRYGAERKGDTDMTALQ